MKYLFLVLVTQISFAIGLQINCEFTDSPEYPVIGSVYECRIFKSLSDLNVNALVSVSGNLPPGRSFSEIKILNFDNTENLTFIPQGILNSFRNVNALRLYNTGLQNLFADQLKEYPKLTWLSLSNNKIVTVPEDFLLHVPKLVYLNLNSNGIKYVDFNFLNNVNYINFQYIGFKNNVCVNREFMQSTYGNQPAFYELMNDLQRDCVEETTVTSTLPPTTTRTSTSTVPSTTRTSSQTTTSKPTCSGDLNAQICELNTSIRNLAEATRLNQVVFKRMEEVLVYVQESLREAMNILNNQTGRK